MKRTLCGANRIGEPLESFCFLHSALAIRGRASGIEGPSSTVAGLRGVRDRENERRQALLRLSEERNTVFYCWHRQVPGAIWGWSPQAGWFEMRPTDILLQRASRVGQKLHLSADQEGWDSGCPPSPPRPGRVCITSRGAVCLPPGGALWLSEAIFIECSVILGPTFVLQMNDQIY